MRVIGGEFRSRRLKSVSGEATRPTPDRLRETLFDILAARIHGATFADAYAGTGAVGIEALSRGAAHAYFFEKNRVALDAIRENLAVLDIEARATVVAGAVARTLALWSADIVFVDPPYAQEREYAGAHDCAAFGAFRIAGAGGFGAYAGCAAGGQCAELLRAGVMWSGLLTTAVQVRHPPPCTCFQLLSFRQASQYDRQR
jgi:16S rRNA G966 N2-methylase RsmD